MKCEMRRFLILLLLALIVLPAGVQAQSSDPPLTAALDKIGVEWDGWATKSFTIAGISFDKPIGYAFIGIDLSTDSDAKTVIDELPAELNRILAERYDVDPEIFRSTSGGQVGDQRHAASANITSDDYDFSLGYLMARSEHFVVIGVAYGLLISPIIEVAPYVERALEHIASANPTNWEMLRFMLPQLDDMPIGYTDDDDDIPETPTPAAKPSPTPHVTPTPPPSDTSIHLHGTGSHKESRMVLDAGRYVLTFSCSTTTGSAEMFWNALGTATTLLTTGDDPSTRFYTLTASAVTSVEIACAGDWGFDVVPM